jgi:hypothetical protein
VFTSTFQKPESLCSAARAPLYCGPIQLSVQVRTWAKSLRLTRRGIGRLITARCRHLSRDWAMGQAVARWNLALAPLTSVHGLFHFIGFLDHSCANRVTPERDLFCFLLLFLYLYVHIYKSAYIFYLSIYLFIYLFIYSCFHLLGCMFINNLLFYLYNYLFINLIP